MEEENEIDWDSDTSYERLLCDIFVRSYLISDCLNVNSMYFQLELLFTSVNVSNSWH